MYKLNLHNYSVGLLILVSLYRTTKRRHIRLNHVPKITSLEVVELEDELKFKSRYSLNHQSVL